MLNVAGEAIAGCDLASSASYAIFAGGDNCQDIGVDKDQVVFSGSEMIVEGRVHSNEDIKISGSSNAFGVTNNPWFPPDPDPTDNDREIANRIAAYDPNPPSPPPYPEDAWTYVYPQSGDPGSLVGPPGPSPYGLEISGSDNVWDPGYPQHVSPVPWPFERFLSQYQSAPPGTTSNVDYFYVNGDIDGVYIQGKGEGVYYATGDIKVDKDLGGTEINPFQITLVAEGTIDVSESNNHLEPYPAVDPLLMFAGQHYMNDTAKQCSDFAIKMPGSTTTWKGVIYAPFGLIEMSGSENTTLEGSLIGWAIKINGSKLQIIAPPAGAPSVPRLRLLR